MPWFEVQVEWWSERLKRRNKGVSGAKRISCSTVTMVNSRKYKVVGREYTMSLGKLNCILSNQIPFFQRPRRTLGYKTNGTWLGPAVEKRWCWRRRKKGTELPPKVGTLTITHTQGNTVSMLRYNNLHLKPVFVTNNPVHLRFFLLVIGEKYISLAARRISADSYTKIIFAH